MSIKCPKCQFENPDDTIYCGKCTSPLRPLEEISATKTFETPAAGLTSGTTFATRYEVIEEVGTGGMGRVYKALDKEINEEVAIKLLKPEIASDETTVERFRNELKFARKIAHKNVCKMYHLGKEQETPFITMEYVPGEDLKSFIKRKGKLSDDEALSIAKQVCEGLVEAHRLGVVHRDLKPQNIMIDEAGDVKIMDFGIARSIEAPGVTQTGVMIGTPDYISPEQAEGEEADHRADIYSLGVILYEMVTGRVPFKGDTALEVALKHKSKLAQDPKQLNPDISDELNKLILICMEKDRERRYQTADELLVDLNNIEEGLSLGERKLPKKKLKFKWKNVFLYGCVLLLIVLIIAGAFFLFTGRPETIDSIAVLPFENLTGDPEQEYFSDGITDELIARLGHIGAFKRVISHWSVMQYKETEKPLQEIAQELNVDAVVTGSVQQAVKNVSIQVRLIDAFPEERNLWEETFDRAMTDVLVMYSDIAHTIASEIKVKLSPDEDTHLTAFRQVNPETYEAYLKGMYNLNKGTPEEFQQGMAYFQEAVEKNPKDPLAFAGLAFGYVTLGHNPLGPRDAWPRARAAADSALRLDPTLAEAHAALADCKLYGEWDFEGAEQGFLRVNELNPNLAMNHYHHAWYLALMGRLDEAIEVHQRAKELDPFEPLHTAWLGWLYFWDGEFDKAMDEAQEAIEINSNYPTAHWILAEVYVEKGMHDEAIASVRKAAELAPPIFGWAEGRIYARIGQTEEARKILAELETQEVTPWATITMASLNGILGEMDEAFRWLEKGYEIRTAWLPWIRVDALFEPHRQDPRIHDLIKRMNLPPIE